MIIDLQDNITPHFKWYEALYLASWDVYVFPNTMTIADDIKLTCEKLEAIRAFLNCPLQITSFYRPPHYNLTIGGARHSMHMQGKAADFVPIGMDVNYAKLKIREAGLLHSLNIRMENNGDGLWIHIDRGEVKRGRFFLP